MFFFYVPLRLTWSCQPRLKLWIMLFLALGRVRQVSGRKSKSGGAPAVPARLLTGRQLLRVLKPFGGPPPTPPAPPAGASRLVSEWRVVTWKWHSRNNAGRENELGTGWKPCWWRNVFAGGFVCEQTFAHFLYGYIPGIQRGIKGNVTKKHFAGYIMYYTAVKCIYKYIYRHIYIYW